MSVRADWLTLSASPPPMAKLRAMVVPATGQLRRVPR